MKRLLLLFGILSLLTLPAAAVEPEPGDPPVDSSADSSSSSPITSETINTEEGVTVNVTITQPEIASEPVVEEPEADPVDSSSNRTFSVTKPTVLETIQSGADASVMADVIAGVLGEYQRQTYTVQELDANGNVISTSTEYVQGLAGLDYHWLAGAAIFFLFFSGAFKLLGGLIR